MTHPVQRFSLRHDRRTRRATAAALAVLLPLLVTACGTAEAQELRLPGLGGGELRESDLQSGPVVVVVWASWSPRGRDIVERANDIHARWNGQARVVTVNYQESRADVQAFLRGKNLRPPVYLDTEGEFSKKYSRPNLPVLVVFKGGDVVLKTALPDDPHGAIGKALG